MPLYKHLADLAGNKKLVLPVPSFNIINGGSHAGNALAMQVPLPGPLADSPAVADRGAKSGSCPHWTHALWRSTVGQLPEDAEKKEFRGRHHLNIRVLSLQCMAAAGGVLHDAAVIHRGFIGTRADIPRLPCLRRSS